MNRVRESLILMTTALFLLGGTLRAQGTASIDGTVVDSSDAAVPAASVSLTNADTAETRATTSSAQGYFTFTDLGPGKYILKVSVTGFKAWEQHDIILSVDQHATLRPQLQIGEMNQTIEVTAAAPLVTTSQSSLSTVVGSTQIEELPLNGRNALQLVELAPGVVSTGTTGQFGATVLSFASSGGRDIDVNYLLDGGTNQNPFYAQPIDFPSPDALQEFAVSSRNYNAQYGRGSTTVSAVTRSGSNAFHGSAFEFLRNNDLDSRPFFSASVPDYKRNQFGGTFGGPIRKNKLFFFASYQGTQVRGAPGAAAYTTLTAAERTGDFSAESTPIINPATGLQFGGNVIPPGDIETQATNFITQWLPTPNLGSNIYNYTPSNSLKQNQVIGKVDYMISQKDRLTGRYLFDNIPQISILGDGSGLDASWKGSLPTRYQSGTIDYIHTFTPALLNDLNITGIRSAFSDNNLVDFSLGALGYPVNYGDAFSSFGLTPDSDLSIGGYFGVYPGAPTRDIMPTWYVADNVSWVHGIHSINAGMMLYRNRINELQNFFTGGALSFSGQFTGDGAADFLLGDASSYEQIEALTSRLHQTLPSVYVQDDIKVSRRVTVNVGLRWDPITGYNSEDSQLATFRPGAQSTLFPLATPGMLYPGDGGLPFNIVGSRRDNFAPRVGIAWDVFGTGKTSIRAGAGTYFIPLTRGITFNRFTLIQPFVVDLTVKAPNAANIWAGAPYNGVDPFPRPMAGNLAGLKQLPFLDYAGESALALPFKSETAEEWSFSIQQQLWRNAILEADYSGSSGSHLTTSVDSNPAIYGSGATLANTQSRLLDPLIGPINTIGDILGSNYNSLQISFLQRFSHGVSVQSYYTYSKALGSTGSEGEGSNGPRDPFDYGLDYGPLYFDLKDNWVTSMLYQPPPFLTSSSPFVRTLANGWGLTGIITVQSGPPLDLQSGVDNSLSDIGSDTPDQVGSWQISGGRSKAQQIAEWFNPAAFVPNAIGTFGNVGRDSLRSPGFWNWDMAALRSFTPREGWRVEFRASFYNIFNHANLGAPGNTQNSPSFGEILSTSTPRNIEFSLRLSF